MAKTKVAKKRTTRKRAAAGTSGKRIRILSIDGGGIRGILPGQILVGLEQKLKEQSKNDNARIADYFDLIAGTSTGGILTCAYLCPEPDSNRPKYTAAEAVDIYLERGDEIFDVSFWQKSRSLGGLTDEKYDAAELEEALDDTLGEVMLAELVKPCLITAYDVRRRKPHFFRQHDAVQHGAGRNFRVKDVARATSAAPTFFEAARIKSEAKVTYPLIDGGVFANNPAMCAYTEARVHHGFSPDRIKFPHAKDMIMVSLGTDSGQKKRASYNYKEVKDWGQAEWILPLIDILMAGNQDTIDYQLRQIFESTNVSDQYHRLEPDLGRGSRDMDNGTVENLEALREAGTEWVDDDRNSKLLDKIARQLIAEA
jgi:patatin-like phospholipase/acyl hydrolase